MWVEYTDIHRKGEMNGDRIVTVCVLLDEAMQQLAHHGHALVLSGDKCRPYTSVVMTSAPLR